MRDNYIRELREYEERKKESYCVGQIEVRMIRVNDDYREIGHWTDSLTKHREDVKELRTCRVAEKLLNTDITPILSQCECVFVCPDLHVIRPYILRVMNSWLSKIEEINKLSKMTMQEKELYLNQYPDLAIIFNPLISKDWYWEYMVGYTGNNKKQCSYPHLEHYSSKKLESWKGMIFMPKLLMNIVASELPDNYTVKQKTVDISDERPSIFSLKRLF